MGYITDVWRKFPFVGYMTDALISLQIRQFVIYPTNEIFSDRPIYTICKPFLHVSAYIGEALMISVGYTFGISSDIQIHVAKYESSRKIFL